jgi:hypothetical protein
MRLLRYDSDGNFSLTEDLIKDIPPYAILSHTWRAPTEEVTFKDFIKDCIDATGKSKIGYAKYGSVEIRPTATAYNTSGWTHAALYSPTTEDNALQKARCMPPETAGSSPSLIS